MKKSLTYKDAGVNISLANDCVADIKKSVKRTRRPGICAGIGSFGAAIRIPSGYKNPLLVSSTDGVGTKLKVAFSAGIHHTVGIDLVAMNVNDILCMGAEPLFFLDYFSCGKLRKKIMIDVVDGISEGCVQAGCALIGGETAEMPDMYPDGEYDLAGFCVGVVERSDMISGKTIQPGDVLIGLASSGVHSNGYSLVRKVYHGILLQKRAKELLTPTRIYVKPVLKLLKKIPVKGISHITGGAFYEKLPRIFPLQTTPLVRKSSWPVPELFQEMQRLGDISDKEMYRTFNMGVGMVLVVSARHSDAAVAHFKSFRIPAWRIGEVIKRGRGKPAVAFE